MTLSHWFVIPGLISETLFIGYYLNLYLFKHNVSRRRRTKQQHQQQDPDPDPTATTANEADEKESEEMPQTSNTLCEDSCTSASSSSSSSAAAAPSPQIALISTSIESFELISSSSNKNNNNNKSIALKCKRALFGTKSKRSRLLNQHKYTFYRTTLYQSYFMLFVLTLSFFLFMVVPKLETYTFQSMGYIFFFSFISILIHLIIVNPTLFCLFGPDRF